MYRFQLISFNDSIYISSLAFTNLDMFHHAIFNSDGRLEISPVWCVLVEFHTKLKFTGRLFECTLSLVAVLSISEVNENVRRVDSITSYSLNRTDIQLTHNLVKILRVLEFPRP